MPIGLSPKSQRGPQGEARGLKFPSSFPLSRGLNLPIFRFSFVIFILTVSDFFRSLTHLSYYSSSGLSGKRYLDPIAFTTRYLDPTVGEVGLIQGALRKSSGLWALSVSRPSDLSMALTATKLHITPVVSAPSATCEPRAVSCSVSSSHHQSLSRKIQKGNSIELRNSGYRVCYCGRSFRCLCAGFIIARRSTAVCLARGGSKAEAEGIVTRSVHHSDTASDRCKNEETGHHYAPSKVICSKRALAEACKYVYNDAKYVNEKARNDIILLSRGILSLDARARQDLAFLESQFLKVDGEF
ncbi:Senescence-associated protein SPA15, chloroplastic-like protein [Drosera capensis]